MAKYLTQEWVERVRELTATQAELPGLTSRVEFVVSGAPDGEGACSLVMEDGKVIETAIGRLAEPEIAVSTTYMDAVKMQRGELDPSVAYMQGKLKVTGDLTMFMRLLALTRSPECGELRSKVGEVTEY